MVLCGSAAMNIRRMEAAILNIGAEIDWTTTPLELGWEAMIDWQREFIGREALIAQRDKGVARRIAGLLLEGKTVARGGDAVRHEGRQVGTVSSAMWGPTIEKSIALATLDTPAWHEGTALEIATEAGAMAARVVSLPFFDAERKLPRA